MNKRKTGGGSAADFAAMAALPIEELDAMLAAEGVDPATVDADHAKFLADIRRRLEAGEFKPDENFRVRVAGWSRRGPLADGSVAKVDSDCRVGDGDVVAVDVDGRRLVKRLDLDASGGGALASESGDFPPIPFDDVSELHIVGRVAKAGPRR